MLTPDGVSSKPSNKPSKMSETPYDLAVIGAGPGGYVAAIRASQLGLRTLLIDKHEALGGTCLNVGCIPSKALLHSSHLYEQTHEGLAEHGITAGKVTFDLKGMQKRKEGIVSSLTGGISFLMKKNRIEVVAGYARLDKAGAIQIFDGEKKRGKVEAKNILLALGSKPTLLPDRVLPSALMDERRVLTSTGALALSSVPRRLCVIGAGVIGLELGSVWARLGSEVIVLDRLDHIAGLDEDTSRGFQKCLEKQGLVFKLKTDLLSIAAAKEGVAIKVQPAGGAAGGKAGGKEETLQASHALVAVGRSPATRDCGLEDAGVECDKRGFVQIDEHFRTTREGIFAIGDCVRGAMLAHKAEEEGVAVVESLAGGQGHLGHVDYATIAGIVYTNPEVASVGLSEREAKEQGISYKIGKFPFSANARAKTSGVGEGFVKLGGVAGLGARYSHLRERRFRSSTSRTKCAGGCGGINSPREDPASQRSAPIAHGLPCASMI